MLISQKNINYIIKYAVIIVCIFVSTMTFSQSVNIRLANEYYNNGDYEKAEDLYKSLARSPRNIPNIHTAYFNLLITTGKYNQAEKYINKVLRTFPQFVNYHIDKGLIYKNQAKQKEADNQFSKIIDGVKKEKFDVTRTAQFFYRAGLTDYAIDTYKIGRKKAKDKTQYALDLANIYRFTSNNTMMVEEYLNFLKAQPHNMEYVQNTLQGILTEPEDFENLETMMIEKVQKEPNEEIYTEMLIWVNLQTKNFYQAFIQSRAFDKRYKTEGNRTMQVGAITLINKDYKTAAKIFEYIIKEYPGGHNNVLARRSLIKTREEMIKNVFPVDTTEIRKLTVDYDKLTEQYGYNAITLEGKRNQAQLYAFYLDNLPKAVSILEEIVKIGNTSPNLKAQCKLDLGDIYMLKNEPWESTLIYSQVEKSHKEQPLGYEAKLRNAKLNYYTGNFELAHSHLDILKLATSREISNDAILLSLLIKDNTLLDTTEIAMKKFATIELLLFQNKNEEAIVKLDELLVNHSNHSLTDEILWKKSQIVMQQGDFEKSLELLDKITSNYGEDILGDDAFFLKGKIYEDQIKDKTKAMKIFQEFMSKYPGSVYVAEARKRFRKLRGDEL